MNLSNAFDRQAKVLVKRIFVQRATSVRHIHEGLLTLPNFYQAYRRGSLAESYRFYKAFCPHRDLISQLLPLHHYRFLQYTATNKRNHLNCAKKAEEVAESMNDLRIPFTTFCYELLIGAHYASNNNLKRMDYWFERLKADKNAKLNSQIYSILIKARGKHKNLIEADLLYKDMLKNVPASEFCHIASCALIEAYGNAYDTDNARRIFDTKYNQMKTKRLPPSSKYIDSMIKAYASNSELEKAQELYATAYNSLELRIDSSSLDAIITACKACDNLELAFKYFFDFKIQMASSNNRKVKEVYQKILRHCPTYFITQIPKKNSTNFEINHNEIILPSRDRRLPNLLGESRIFVKTTYPTEETYDSLLQLISNKIVPVSDYETGTPDFQQLNEFSHLYEEMMDFHTPSKATIKTIFEALIKIGDLKGGLSIVNDYSTVGFTEGFHGVEKEDLEYIRELIKRRYGLETLQVIDLIKESKKRDLD